MGYEFQKLYAANYMQWHKNHFRIWKRGNDITHDSIDLYQLVKFLRTKPKLRAWDDCKTFAFYKFYDQAGKYCVYLSESEENKKLWRANANLWDALPKDTPGEDLPPRYTTEYIGIDVIEQLQELNYLGWYHLERIPEEELI